MKGDFSRGHSPDRQPYRRVLHQQGRVLLDSDVAALVAAQDHLHRLTVAGLGCPMGSPNYGWLVTTGKLLALFEHLDRPGARVEAAGTAEVIRDYSAKWLERYPSLRITTTATGDTVHIPLIAPLEGAMQRIVLWVRSTAAVAVTVAAGARSVAVAVPITAGPFERIVIDFGATALVDVDVLDLTVPANAEVWIGLVESDEDVGTAPFFWVAAGWYAVDGLLAERSVAAPYPNVSWPEGAGEPETDLAELIASGDIDGTTPIVAYLEVHERLITAVEDPGLREAALGGLDTSVRTLPVGQVKFLIGAAGLTAAQALDAFAHPVPSDATLEVTTGTSTPDYDPCALPTIDGYAAADHRLYRFEVQVGGALGDVIIKWSRDNGSKLFPILRIDGNQLVFAAGSGVQDGDLVELLGEPIDLGDDIDVDGLTGRAGIDGSGRVVPSRRRTGALVVLQWVDDDADGNPQFQLVDPPTSAVLALATVWPDDEAELDRVRRWNGRLLTVAGTFDYALESGLSIELHGDDFRAGDYWQFQARVGPGNENGEWQSSPHGPERLLAPLALMSWAAGETRLDVEAWLDHRYSPICELDADEIAFDGDRVGSTSDTVQEALEELFERGPEVIEAGCGEIVVRPEVDLQGAFAAIPDGGDARVCIHPGLWELAATVEVANKGNLIVSGAGRATRLVGAGLDVVLRFTNCASVQLRDFDVEAGVAAAEGGLNGAITILGTAGEVLVERLHLACASAVTRRTAALTVRPVATSGPLPLVTVRDCDVQVGHLQTGILLVDVELARIEQNRVWCAEQVIDIAAFANDAALWALLGNVFIDRIVPGDDMASTEPLRNRERVYLRPREAAGWGETLFTFDSHLSLSSDWWQAMLTSNPCPGHSTATEEWLVNNLRKLGRRIARFLLGVPDPSFSVRFPLGAEATARAVLTAVAAENAVSTGGQGIVVAGSRTGPLGAPGGGNSRVYLAPRRPESLVADNRVDGFVQGIHVGTSSNIGSTDTGKHHRTYRTQIRGNTVFLRIPGFARERHGIFVGNVHAAHIRDNIVELVSPTQDGWATMKPVDGIRVFGMIGPTCIIGGNELTGVYTGVRFVGLNPDLPEDGGHVWSVTDNAWFGLGTATVGP